MENKFEHDNDGHSMLGRIIRGRLTLTAFVSLRAVVLGLALAAGPLLADGNDVGQALHDAECTTCHASSVYTRADRKVNSLERLKYQVNLCKEDVGAEWTDIQTGQVIEFLNHAYYKFE